MAYKILVVDDEIVICSVIKEVLRNKYQVETALSVKRGFEIISELGPFAVIIADLRMPIMDGIQFLTKVKEYTPNSIRIIFTGKADLKAAINAINEGNVFRFLIKPCSSEMIIKSVRAGIEQYELITAEKELIEKTLEGSINVLSEILSLVNPVAFSRALRIKEYVIDIVNQLHLPDLWQYKLAAMLSQIGCLALPSEILNKVYADETLNEKEQKIFSNYPVVGSKLLCDIPRLEIISQMIGSQQKHFKEYKDESSINKDQKTISIGAQILKVALDLDILMVRGKSLHVAVSRLGKKPDEYNPIVLKAVENIPIHKFDRVAKMIEVKNLRNSMIIDEDVKAKSGVLLVSKGQLVTNTVLELLRSFSQGIGVTEPFRVLVLQ